MIKHGFVSGDPKPIPDPESKQTIKEGPISVKIPTSSESADSISLLKCKSISTNIMEEKFQIPNKRP